MKTILLHKILRAITLISLMLMLQACVTTIVGAVVDTAIEVVKIPFKVGGAIIDAASSDKEEDRKAPAEKK
jgi:hypothetical protein